MDPENPTANPAGLDQRKIRRSFARAASSYDTSDFLQSEVRARLLDRLQWIRLNPRRVVDLGSGTGKALPQLADRFPGVDLLAIDLTEGLLRHAASRESARAMAVCGDASLLPLPDQSVDLVFSSLMLHWCPSLDQALREVRRVLAFPGLFTFATLGPRSFQELRAAWRLVDEGTHVMAFPEMRALADGLLRAGLAEPVVDSETLTIHYRDLRQLTADLRGTGTTNPSARRESGLTGRRTWQRLEAACDRFRDAGGALPVTLEIIYGQGWTQAARKQGQATEVTVPLAAIGRRSDGQPP